MGSREIRLKNEALRCEQASVEGKDRAAGRQALREAVKTQLTENVTSQQAMKEAQLQDFNKFRQDRNIIEKARLQEAADAYKARSEKRNELSMTVQDSLRQFHADHAVMNNNLRQELQNANKKRLTEERLRLDEAGRNASELAAHVKGVRRDTSELLKSFNAEHRGMHKQQQEFLKNEEARRKEQARQEKEARLEFFYKSYDLDLGVKKKIIQVFDEGEKISTEVSTVAETPVPSPEPERTKMSVVPEEVEIISEAAPAISDIMTVAPNESEDTKTITEIKEEEYDNVSAPGEYVGPKAMDWQKKNRKRKS